MTFEHCWATNLAGKTCPENSRDVRWAYHRAAEAWHARDAIAKAEIEAKDAEITKLLEANRICCEAAAEYEYTTEKKLISLRSRLERAEGLVRELDGYWNVADCHGECGDCIGCRRRQFLSESKPSPSTGDQSRELLKALAESHSFRESYPHYAKEIDGILEAT